MARDVDVRVDEGDGFTPTPAVSHAILVANRPKDSWRRPADGIVVTPSHNPPDDGFKYNPPNGGPADTDVTRWVQDEANRILEATGSDGIDGSRVSPTTKAAIAGRRLPRSACRRPAAIDMEAIHGSARIGVDPMGGASVAYGGHRPARHRHHGDERDRRPDVRVHDRRLGRQDPMDPSSPSAMARLVELRDQFDIALANDADADRHGRDARAWLAQPEPFPERRDRLPVRRRPGMGERRWRREDTGVLIDDRPGRGRPRRLFEVPARRRSVDDGSIGFGGEESAGASFLRRDGTVWTTDKDGIIADLLACELTARTGQDPVWRTASSRSDRVARLQASRYPRDTGAEGGARRTERVRCDGQGARRRTDQRDPDRGTGNGAPIGGLKVTTESGWFAPAVGDGERRQGLRGELQGRGPPRATLPRPALVGEVTSGA